MLNLYRKTLKSKENRYGATKIEEGENPFKEGPVFLCISAQDIPKSVFGITKHGMTMAGMHTKGMNQEGFDIENFPITFLAIRDEECNEAEKEYEFAKKYFQPLISSENGEPIDINQLMRSFRNINIMSYCDGTIRVANIVEATKRIMSEMGYSGSEIESSISQIGLVSLSTNVDLDSIGCTVVDFHDLNDDEVMDCESNIDDEIEDSTRRSTIGETLSILPSGKRAEYTIIGSGEHYVREFQDEGTAMPSCARRVIGNMLENSLQNAKGSFTPINAEVLTYGCESIIEQAKQGTTKEQLISEVDKSLSYGGARRLTARESSMYDKLAESYDHQIRLESELSCSQKQADSERKKSQQILNEAERICSHENYLRILSASGWQLNKEQIQEMSNSPTDKELIDSQETRIKNLRSMLSRTLEFANTVKRSVFGKVFFGKAAKQLPEGENIER